MFTIHVALLRIPIDDQKTMAEQRPSPQVQVSAETRARWEMLRSLAGISRKDHEVGVKDSINTTSSIDESERASAHDVVISPLIMQEPKVEGQKKTFHEEDPIYGSMGSDALNPILGPIEKHHESETTVEPNVDTSSIQQYLQSLAQDPRIDTRGLQAVLSAEDATMTHGGLRFREENAESEMDHDQHNNKSNRRKHRQTIDGDRPDAKPQGLKSNAIANEEKLDGAKVEIEDRNSGARPSFDAAIETSADANISPLKSPIDIDIRAHPTSKLKTLPNRTHLPMRSLHESVGSRSRERVRSVQVKQAYGSPPLPKSTRDSKPVGEPQILANHLEVDKNSPPRNVLNSRTNPRSTYISSQSKDPDHPYSSPTLQSSPGNRKRDVRISPMQSLQHPFTEPFRHPDHVPHAREGPNEALQPSHASSKLNLPLRVDRHPSPRSTAQGPHRPLDHSNPLPSAIDDPAMTVTDAASGKQHMLYDQYTDEDLTNQYPSSRPSAFQGRRPKSSQTHQPQINFEPRDPSDVAEEASERLNHETSPREDYAPLQPSLGPHTGPAGTSTSPAAAFEQILENFKQRSGIGLGSGCPGFVDSKYQFHYL